MENIYIFMIAALAILAIADLVVGVSNDAVNFLNSAIGSKAVTFKTVMVVASVGIAFGALSSSGMMEVARKGIFDPSQFYFDEIMIIFMAVMITDIILLDIFNSLGMPTSTTVSIVFELLGASVVMSIIKISNNSDSLAQIGEYINTDKATEIILGILLSVFIAFTIGAIIQFLTRFLLTFNFEKKPSWIAAVFGGFAVSSISYFIIIKGLKGANILPPEFSSWANDNLIQFLGANFIIWTAVSWVFHAILKQNIYKLVIILGTFALAMAFAGNDLVNFIGVPMAAYNSFIAWSGSGILPSAFSMEQLAEKVPTQPILLLVAGLIMVLTLWFSKKARRVVKTSVDLSRQDEVKERFKPNWVSQHLVRGVIIANNGVNKILPAKLRQSINKSFEPSTVIHTKASEAPAFDMVRAAVNLVIASVLISVATGLKLPLSTTYVTFMVAMGTSLADRAWGAESAVYRVAGVLNVISGWFLTAFSAFTAAGILAYLMYLGGNIAIIGLFFLAIAMLVRNYLSTKKKNKEAKIEEDLRKAESKTISGIIEESADNIAKTIIRTDKIYTGTLKGLAKNKVGSLRKSRATVEKLNEEIDELRNNIFYFIKNLEETSVRGSNFYIEILGYLEDITQSLEYIAKVSYKHVNNNHKPLRFNQIRDLQEIDNKLCDFLQETAQAFKDRNYNKIEKLLGRKQELYGHVTDKIQKQVERTRSEESSPKNTTLYFGLLLETKDLIEEIMNLLELYNTEHKRSK
ncbi:phosphate transporter family protein [Dokdonia sp. Hel_I_63]|uniref:inorganic phosphate transporter n=1 Tax=Dokdonia sp. Hel_I_63 TaxID=1249996 RepID=UPI00119C008A|nr:inorganic phosphate transporter [Dokdonia sp. Hel_I_63]TVZ21272.1 phosphate transporter family protein [Dokdonia sp. Hel_I_63]